MIMIKQSKYGQRKSRMMGIKKWMSRLTTSQINVFPVPGEEIFRSKGIHLQHLGYEVAANSRQANLMMVAGPINEYLAKKAAIAFVQMPRPRCLVFVESSQVNHLPPPDFKIQGQENDFIQLKDQLKNFFANPFSEEADALEVPFIKEMLEEQENQQQGHQHHHHGHGDHQHGEENDEQEHEHHPKQAQEKENHHHHGDEEQHEQHQQHEEHESKKDDHSHHDHEHQQSNDEKKHQHEKHSQGEHQGHTMKHDQQEGNEHQEHENQEHSHEDHEGHEHDGHGGHGGHGGGGFMSMVMMTKDMPPAMDGLRMEHNQAWFGPLFPGLTGGLAFQMMLDGDTVMKITPDKNIGQHQLSALCGTSAKDLPEKLAALNPLAPANYRILAEAALQKLFGNTNPLTFSQVAALEKERIGSHLNWLATLGTLAGNQWIYNSAVQVLADYQRDRNHENIIKLSMKIQHFKYLKKKLCIGSIPSSLLHHTSGPVARAAGITKDLRAEEENYQKLDFAMITLNENNAWGRLKMRLLEIEQSIELIRRIEKENKTISNPGSAAVPDGVAALALETTGGVTEISIEVKQGKVEQLQLQPVANINLSIATKAVSHMELSDALHTIHSLDINPYEIIIKSK